MRRLSLVTVPLAVLALSACGQEPVQRGDDGRAAEGEVLGGSISDEMIPLDQLQSQSPPLREAPPVETGEEGGGEEEGAAEEAEGADQAEPAQPPETPEVSENEG